MAPSKPRKVRLTIQGADGKMYDVQAEIVGVWSAGNPPGNSESSAAEVSLMDWPVLAPELVPEQER